MSEKERMIVIEDGKVEYREYTRSSASDSNDLFPSDGLTSWESSEAFLDWYGNSARPVIEIGESTIWVYHQAIGGGYVRGTSLNGPNGDFFFATGNQSYTVPPGRYTHSVAGHIGGSDTSGRIASGVRYKRPKV